MNRPGDNQPRQARDRLQVVLMGPGDRPNRKARVDREAHEIQELLGRKAKGILRERVASMHPADLAEHMEDLGKAQIKLLLSVATNERVAEVLAAIEDEDVSLMVARQLGRTRLADVLDTMPSDDVVDLLARFDPEELDRVLDELDDEDAADFKELLSFSEESAGGLMEIELVPIRATATSAQVIEIIRKNRDELETINYLYVTDEQNRLVGVVSLRELMLADPEATLETYMEPDVIRVHVSDDQEDVAQLVAKYDLLAVPVVGDGGVMKGIVTVDDILDVLEEEATEDMFGMAGLAAEEAEEESAFRSAARRLPWLFFTLMGGFCSGFILRWFQPALDQVVALAIFIPSIMALGGNIAVQSSTLMVRGFATGDLEETDVRDLLFKEIRVGILLGVLLGSTAGALGSAWLGNPYLGGVVAISMTAQFTVAATMGVFIPWALMRLGADPALSSGPFVTMVSDLTGLIIYFSLASAGMQWLAA